MDKELKLLLDIIKNFFNLSNEVITPPKKLDYNKFYRYVKETVSEGIVYLWLKNNNLNLPKKEYEYIQKGYKIICNVEKRNKRLLDIIKKSNIQITLLKENIYKQHKNYRHGSRFSWDLDVYVSTKDLLKFDAFLERRGFISDTVEIRKDILLEKRFWQVNKDIFLAPGCLFELKNEIKKHTSNKKKLNRRLQKDIILQRMFHSLEDISLEEPQSIEKKVKELERYKRYLNRYIGDIYETMDLLKEQASVQKNIIKNRYQKILEALKIKKSINYNYKDGSYLDVHFRLGEKEEPYQLHHTNLKFIKIKNNVYRFSPESEILFNALHYCSNLKKYKTKYKFHGFLRYLTDLAYTLQNNKIDWVELRKISKKTNASSQVYFYLTLGKKLLRLKIPKREINILKKNGSVIQNILLNKIDIDKLIINKSDKIVKLYALMYLIPGIPSYITSQIHRLFNKLAH